MFKVALNQYYHIHLSPRKNRIYCKLNGFWPSTARVEAYEEHLTQALTKIKSGASILFDLSDMKVHPPEVKLFHSKVERLLRNSGVQNIAEVVADNVLMEVEGNSPNSISSKFTTIQEADKWLDFRELDKEVLA
ncbi:hypothetical protein [Aureibacter tunicatorum]|uniref:Uncharacterized protein n=1 Tax=Aureibacter tunicatorum TaxID=866807 RepID=A0AAE3XM80_9BACT|nr:hypothetical protein [Aureibacter tunicatorum]MDR6239017.1 hypothetical protein [Aureibacter tunicatorum]BDD05057.1 hypothetical protein AUTU_25400 [Aureibacter tunicatorum]